MSAKFPLLDEGVRLDTPSSRRGNFADIVREVRWELDRNGKKDVGIIVSGGIKEEDVEQLKQAGASGFGVGTAISSAAAIDFAMDIVNVEGKDKTKKGKYSGSKNVFRCRKCHSYLVSVNQKEKCPNDGTQMESMYQRIVDGGKVVYREKIDESRKYVLEQLRWFQLS
jgi:nicotinate phosphoribosyltransferase